MCVFSFVMLWMEPSADNVSVKLGTTKSHCQPFSISQGLASVKRLDLSNLTLVDTSSPGRSSKISPPFMYLLAY